MLPPSSKIEDLIRNKRYIAKLSNMEPLEIEFSGKYRLKQISLEYRKSHHISKCIDLNTLFDNINQSSLCVGSRTVTITVSS